jgi:hypothetical protein
MSALFLSASTEYIEGTNGASNGAIQNVNGATLTGFIYPNSLPYSPSYILVVSTNVWNSIRAAIGINANGSIYAAGRCLDADSLQSATSTAGDITTYSEWHIAATFDYSGKTIKIYRNGSLIKTQGSLTWGTAPTSNTASPLTMCGGWTAATNWSDGYIDDCRVYNRVLTAGEIQSLRIMRGADCIVQGLQNRFRMSGYKPNANNLPQFDRGPMKFNLTRSSATVPIITSDKYYTNSKKNRQV